MNKTRDGFSQKTKDTLGSRVGYLCSNPTCKTPTVGPNSKQDKFTNIGVAAHISAASPNGPRYDSKITSEVRKDISNGIWLCQKCSVLIDRDEEYYTEIKIREWKSKAETEALKSLEQRLAKGTPFTKSGKIIDLEGSGFYEKLFGDQKIRFHLEGDLLHVEQVLPDNAIVYWIMDQNGKMIDFKLPYPMLEYEIVIDPSLIINKNTEILSDDSTKETIDMKWKKQAIIIKNRNSQLEYFNIKGGYLINHKKRKIEINSPKFTDPNTL